MSSKFPQKKYSVIYADPPWRYQDRTPPQGGAEAHYPTMKLEDICGLPIAEICEENCVLFMWATYPLLPEAIKVLQSWGFTYKSVAFTWVKENKSGNGFFFGLGRWTRGNPEICLLGVKGKPKRISASVANLTISPLQRHSQKPDIIREKIVDLLGDLPRIELFARKSAQGWDSWGNEI
jgi:site-specific DNA-methyltransferase (adenine-specific)